MKRNSYVVGTVVEPPHVVTVAGQTVVQLLLDCAKKRRILVEGPVLVVSDEAVTVRSGLGASLLRWNEGDKIGVSGDLKFGPVRIRIDRVFRRNDVKPMMQLPLGVFKFLGYRTNNRSADHLEATIELLDGRGLRVVMPDNLFVGAGSYLQGSLGWDYSRGFRAPYRLTNVVAWRPVEVRPARVVDGAAEFVEDRDVSPLETAGAK